MESSRPIILMAGLPGTLREEATGILRQHLLDITIITYNGIHHTLSGRSGKSRESVYDGLHSTLELALAGGLPDLSLVLDAPYEALQQRKQVYDLASRSLREVLVLEFLTLPVFARQRLQHDPAKLAEYDMLHAVHEPLRHEFPAPYKEPEQAFRHVSAVGFMTDPAYRVGPHDPVFTTMISRLTDATKPVYEQVRAVLLNHLVTK